MPEKSTGWLNLEEKGAAGDFSDLIDPLDFKILAEIPEEGTMFAGLYPVGTSSRQLAETFKKITPKEYKPMNPAQFATRLRVMRSLGLIQTVVMPSSGNGKLNFQRTAKGKEIFEAWQRIQAK